MSCLLKCCARAEVGESNRNLKKSVLSSAGKFHRALAFVTLVPDVGSFII